MICPILTNGWLSSKWAAKHRVGETLSKNNYAECLKEECAMWEVKRFMAWEKAQASQDPEDKGKCGFRLIK